MKKIILTLILFVQISPLAFSSILDGEIRITLKADQEPITECLSKITEQTGISFIYGNEILANIRISCDFRNIPLTHALHTILSPRHLEYKLTSGNQIIVYKDKEQLMIRGIVRSKETGEAIPYADITILGSLYGTAANSEGYFILQNIPDNTFSISIRSVGYTLKTIAFQKDSLPSEKMNIFLEEQAIAYRPLIVRGSIPEVFRVENQPGRLTMSPKTFSTLPLLGIKDVSRSLQLMPGISASSFGSAGLDIRGGTSSQNLMLLDGIVLYHMNHAQGFFSAFDPEAVQSINVYKGGYPAKFGGRIAGVIEMNAKSGDINSSHISVGASQMSGHGLAEIPLFGKGSVLVSYRRSISDFILSSIYNKSFNSFRQNVSVYEPNYPKDRNIEQSKNEINFYDFFGKITLLPTKKDIITLSGLLSGDNIKIDGDKTGSSLALDENSNIDNGGLSIKWYREWTPRFNLTCLLASSLCKTDNIKQWDDSKITDTILVNKLSTSNSLKDITANIDGRWDITSSHSIEAGISYSELTVRFNYDTDLTPVYSSQSRRYWQADRAPLYSAYVQDTWNVSGNLTSTIGMRINKYEPVSSAQIEPRASVSYNLTPSITLKGAYGKYHQYLMQYKDFESVLQGRVAWVSADGYKLKPSSSDQYIFGVKYQEKEFLIDGEFYYKRNKNIIENLYEWKIDEIFYQPDEAVQTNNEIAGFDLLIKKKYGSFDGWISYGFSWSETEYYIDKILRRCPSSNNSPQKFAITGSYLLGKFIISATWQYAAGKPYTMPQVETEQQNGKTYYSFLDPVRYNDSRFAPTHQLDISLSYSHNARYCDITCGISAYNIYNQRNICRRFSNIKNGKVINYEATSLGITPSVYLEIRI